MKQAEKSGFNEKEITAKRLNFSHLYTALSRPSVRDYLQIPEESPPLLPHNPVPKDASEQLSNLMGWLYGKSKEKKDHVVRSQNPDLNHLVRVLGNKQAIASLVSKNDLRIAFELVEPPSFRFEEALDEASVSAERCLGLVSHFDPEKQAPLLSTISNLANTVRALRDEMRRRATPKDDL